MTREWQPGDVAMLTYPYGSFVGLRVDDCAEERHHTVPHWHLDNGNHSAGFFAETIRPLVVIDPEDREQVDRLTKAFVETLYAAGQHSLASQGMHPDQTAAALRSLVDPPSPRPDEPLGLGAVVEIESQFAPGEKRRLVRTHHSRQPWFGDTIRQSWDEIPGPITTLSEGVTP